MTSRNIRIIKVILYPIAAWAQVVLVPNRMVGAVLAGLLIGLTVINIKQLLKGE